MPFGIVGRTALGMRQVVRFGGSVDGKWYFWGARGDFTAYVCNSAATRPSSQITLGKLVSFTGTSNWNIFNAHTHFILLSP